MTGGAPLLSIRDLEVELAGEAGPLPVLRGVSLDLARGSILGLVGESGSGKSTLALSILRLLPANAPPPRGTVRLAGVDLLALSGNEMRRRRGGAVAMIFQDPMSALNPLFTVATHLRDVQRNPRLTRSEKRRRALAILSRVGIPDATARLASYPHELSGGMRQRVMIAMALLAEPDLLVADEPTSALDATIALQIVELLDGLRRDFGVGILFISHRLALVAELCDAVAVLYAGTIVEEGPAAAVLAAPRHPYTRLLVACETDESPLPGGLRSVPGDVPLPGNAPPGCIFADRCPDARALCRAERPALRDLGGGRRAACHFA